ncbi:PREDICTED: coagulation factor V [Gekko japonicus]|uniref:Coagulation factor V n=1 Tax=Gekko japonicus TaxID=146911 RepID=A0ABM1JZA0_GEKJA|nr:PREDICTED: coagulation factor V [Gekko japonicus]
MFLSSCGHLLLTFLALGWLDLEIPTVRAARLREHYIAAQFTSWSYGSPPKEQSRVPNSGSLFNKIVYREYEAGFQKEKPPDALSGLLGPTLHAEVGDTLIIHFKNMANKPLSIHPQGISYSKQSEGASYSDKTSPMETLDDAVPSGQTYKYVWAITAEIGPRKADPACLTYTYYSHENMVQDFNSGLIGALLICKEGSLYENGTQKLFDQEYVLMFAVFDETKSWQKVTSLMYTINGYANGTLPDVEACAYDRISWHLIGMSSAPEIFSIHFNGQTLEQNHYKVSTINLVGGASTTANMSVSRTGKWLISSIVQKHLQAGMHGYLKIEECGNLDILTKKLSYKELRMIKDWEYFIAAEEVIWDYAPQIPESVDRQYRALYLENFSNLIGKKYKKAVYRQYIDANFSKHTESTWPKDRGILGPVVRAEVRDRISIVFKNMASRPYSIYVHGVTLSKEAEGAVYPSDSKENSTQSKIVQPGETYTYKWTVLDTDGPTAEDPQCVTRLYHSAVDVTRDIASGLIGHLLICKGRALNQRGVQNKADVEQHAVFAVFDENKSWYLEDNIKQYCSNPSTVKRDDPKFYKSNVMHTLNGFASDGTNILGFCQDSIVEWHLSSVGTQDLTVPVHLLGHTFLNKGKDQDILNLFPMSGESATVTMNNVGTWLLFSWGSREMSNGMRTRFRDVKCETDYTEDDAFYSVFVPPEILPVAATETTAKKERGTIAEDYDYQENLATLYGFQEEDYGGKREDEKEEDSQEELASLLGLRSFNSSAAEEEEYNLTALAMEDTYGTSSTRNYDLPVTLDQVFTNSSDNLHGGEMLETQSTTSYLTAISSLHPNYSSLAEEAVFSDITTVVSILSSEEGQSSDGENSTVISISYNQTNGAEPLRTDGEAQSKDPAELLADTENSTMAIFSQPSSKKEEEDNADGKDTLDREKVKQGLSEAMFFAVKQMRALLFYVQQKRNLSALGNTTSGMAFLAIPRAENTSTLDNSQFNLETDYISDDYDEDEFPILSTNLTSAVEQAAKSDEFESPHASELVLSKFQRHSNSTLGDILGILVPTVIPKPLTERPKVLPLKRQKCPSKKTNYEWNFVSEKENYDTGIDLTNTVDDKFQNSSRNATMDPENTIFPGKKKQERYKGDSQPDLGQEEVGIKHGVLIEKEHENCTMKTSGTFLKARRKKKKEHLRASMTPRGFKPPESSKGLNDTQAFNKANHTMLLNEVNYTLTPSQVKPFVKIGLPNENGDYEEFDPIYSDSEESSSGSVEYETVHYDDPYTTDSRLNLSSVRNPDDIAGHYLRAFDNGYKRIYYIAAVEDVWDYAAFRKSAVKSGSASTVYKKVVFRGYQDSTFRTPVVRREYEDHLGILGPIIRAEVDDVILVHFKNLASRAYSLHAHGLSYEKSSEGRSYDDQSPEWFKNDDAIQPNGTYTYVWHATKRSGPTQDGKVCRSWAYYSAVNPGKDIHSGLIGPILICQKGMLDKYNKPIDMREFVLLFMVFDEKKSWYFNKQAKKTCADRTADAERCHTYPAINGIQYQLPGLRMYQDEMVHWHLLNTGGPKDIHVVHFHGQTFTEQGMEDHQLGVYPLLPGSFRTVQMKPSKAGVWLLDTEVGEYQQAGMQTAFLVIDKECKLPLGLGSGIIQDSQISASDHKPYWEPKLARLHNNGKYNAWSTERKENGSWIQVDLQREVLITGIQTQGAKQLTKHLYTEKYFIAYSKNGRRWIAFRGNSTGAQKFFEGNSDGTGIKENHIDPPIIARYIRVYPTACYNRPTLRMELLGCETEGCSMPLGLENGAIKDAQITASSYKKNWFRSWQPSLARLNREGGVNAWQAKSNNNNQWLQIDLLQPKKITAIVTQGAKSLTTEMYVKAFSILYGDNESTWRPYLDSSTSMEKVFMGNINSNGQIKHFFNPPIFSRFIRIVPKTWNQGIALRMELFGCSIF